MGTGLSDTQWAQARLPIKLSGTEVTDPTFIYARARLSAVLTFFDRGSTLGLPYTSPPPDTRGVLNAVSSWMGPAFEPIADWDAADFDGERGVFPPHKAKHPSREWWSTHLYKAVSSQLATRVRSGTGRASHANVQHTQLCGSRWSPRRRTA